MKTLYRTIAGAIGLVVVAGQYWLVTHGKGLKLVENKDWRKIPRRERAVRLAPNYLNLAGL